MKYTLTIISLAAFTSYSHAALSIVTQANDNGNATNPIEFNSIAVTTGDVVVIATSVNKGVGTIDFSMSTTAGAGDVSGNTTFNASENHASHISYLTVVNPGSYNFTIDPSNTETFTANSSIFILRADSGEISLAGTATTADTGSPTATSLTYNFGSSLTSGSAVAIEALTSQSGNITPDANYSIGNTGGTGRRNTASSTTVNGSSWTASHTMLPVDDDFAGAGAVFSEVPEPSSSLLLLGNLSLLFIRRR